MKKTVAILLAVLMLCSLAACASDKPNDGSVSTDPAPAQSSTPSQDPIPAEGPASALEVLNAVWGKYTEDNKFPVFGGVISEDNMSEEPAKHDISDAEALDNTLGYPAASVDKIDDAASMTHLMNANTFTGAVYHVKNSADVSNVTAALKENIQGRHWICGVPEKLLIATVGDYIVAVFGAEDLVTTFQSNLTAAYSDANIAVNEPIE